MRTRRKNRVVGTRWRAATRFGGPLLLVLLGCPEPTRLERRWTAMGSYASAVVYARTAHDADRAMAEIRDAFERVDANMSNWRPDSELSRLNRQAAEAPYRVEDADLYRCIKIALAYAKATGGRFDPTVGPLMRLYGFRPLEPRLPEPQAVAEALNCIGWEKVDLFPVARSIRFETTCLELDLGGIAKGYALDVAARVFARPGVTAGLLDLGGSLYAWNRPPGEERWVVGIRDPTAPPGVMATVRVSSRAVSTAANLENSFTLEGQTVGHIMDPSTGEAAATDVVAATVLADSGADADVLSTAMIVAGASRSGELLRRARRIEAVLLVRGGEGLTLLVSGSLKGNLEVDQGFLQRVGGRVRYILPPVELERPGLEASEIWDRLLQ